MESCNKACFCFIVQILVVSDSYMDPMQWHSADTCACTRTRTHTWKDMSKLLGTCCDCVNAPENEQNMPQHKVYLLNSKSGLNTFQNI